MSLGPLQPGGTEPEVFALLGLGLATRDIGWQRDLSVKTIETHEARIKKKPMRCDDCHNMEMASRVKSFQQAHNG